ncbi:hypothetical protein TG4357_02637 [Thalassovita gelatinovora]|uniref:Uncharacterized protein n=1 Tax=Thalassovita gelatinovora TaxID=53501 RepID=A0A0P1FF62_THAGE|nr:hypothetical protein [Thalassovita gelatinovora]QIZ79764.1 hypothetical protein HFZ77_04350 [Thalassovita gelatinovora]CUH66787.1 hypothetical protein TG4357_02637 [Thalassovita gelatinovora]SEQ42733.1 hypothetical protein SAMN04488043_105174 [Thalassovita gelatinovora]
MLQLLAILGITLVGAMVFDLSSDEEGNDSSEDDPSEEDFGDVQIDPEILPIDDILLGTEGDDDLTTAPDDAQSIFTASESLEDHVNDDAETVSALEGDDEIEIGNGDQAFGGPGSDIFVANYSFENGLGAAVVEDFEPETETIALRIGGAPSNALPDHETFNLEDDIEVEESQEAGTTIFVEGEAACELPDVTGLTVVWAQNEVSPDHIMDSNQTFFNLDGTPFDGVRNDIDVVVYRFYNYSS